MLTVKCDSSASNRTLIRFSEGSDLLLEIGFSYAEPVYFWTPRTKHVTSENLWGTTTGRHINGFSEVKRTPRPEFLEMLNLALWAIGAGGAA